jgi:hypothetical protein
MKVKKQKDTVHIKESLKSNKIASENVKALICNFNDKIKKNEFRLYPNAKKEDSNKLVLLSDTKSNIGKRTDNFVDYENCVKVSDLLSKKPEYDKVIQRFERVLSRPLAKLKLESSILETGPTNTTPQNTELISVNFNLPGEASLDKCEPKEASESDSSSFLSKKCSTSIATSTSISSIVQLRSLNISNSNNKRAMRSSVATLASSQVSGKFQSSVKKSSIKSSSCCSNKSSSLLGTGWKYFNLTRLCSKSVKINKDFV